MTMRRKPDYALALAKLSKPCTNPSTHPTGGQPRIDIVCPDCKETRTVPALPMLRAICPCRDWGEYSCLRCTSYSAAPKSEGTHSPDCEDCQGHGEIPHVTLETLLRAMEQAGYSWQGDRHNWIFWQTVITRVGHKTKYVGVEDGNHLGAACEAACGALGLSPTWPKEGMKS